MKKRSDVLSTLRTVAGRIQLLQKEIMSMGVPGLHLTREDLGIRRPNKNRNESYSHGQKHYQPRNNNKITTPGNGQGHYPQGIIPGILPRG